MALNLFQSGEFKASSGITLPYKIECDALTDGDWESLAWVVGSQLYYGEVEGVPTGGLKFAEALRKYSVPDAPLLIADDVYTTGQSMENHRAGRKALGVVAFARTPYILSWVVPIWCINYTFSS